MNSESDILCGIPVNAENEYRQDLAQQLEQAAGAWTGELGETKIKSD